ncbi:MAG: hypothetical protein RH917_04415 [Lacipirellulaceae bacterium]
MANAQKTKAPVASTEDFLPRAAPKLMLLGVSIVMIAFALKGVPIAAAIALIALGGVVVVKRVPSLVLALVLYTPLGVLAVAAQMQISLRTASLPWRLALTADAALAILLMLVMLRHAGERLVRDA